MTGPQRVAWYWPREKASPRPVKRRMQKRSRAVPDYTVDKREGCTVYRPASWPRGVWIVTRDELGVTAHQHGDEG
jgi:hypothetical protein